MRKAARQSTIANISNFSETLHCHAAVEFNPHFDVSNLSHNIAQHRSPALEHYVIFFCDDCDRLDPAIAAFKKVQPGIVVHTSSDVNDLVGKISKQRPELLLLYFHDPKKSYVEILKTVRQNTEATSIPVLVYHELPSGPELEKAFIDFRKP